MFYWPHTHTHTCKQENVITHKHANSSMNSVITYLTVRTSSEASHYAPPWGASFSSTQWLSLSSRLPLRSVKYKRTHTHTRTHKHCTQSSDTLPSTISSPSSFFLYPFALLPLPSPALCPLLSHFSILFLPVFSRSRLSFFVGGERFKSPLRCTPSAAFMNHSLLYLFFHFLPLFSFVGILLYSCIFMWGIPPLLFLLHPPRSPTCCPALPLYFPHLAQPRWLLRLCHQCMVSHFKEGALFHASMSLKSDIFCIHFLCFLMAVFFYGIFF